MTRLTARQLITYSVVSQDIEHSNDILAGLMPFYDPIISEMAGQLFDVDIFTKNIVEKYDWPVNPDVAIEIIPRLEAAGRIYKITEEKNKKPAYICNEIAHDEDKEEKELLARKKLQKIAHKFQDFCTKLSPMTTHHYGLEELEEILLNWIVSVEGFDRSALLTSVESLLTSNGSKHTTDTIDDDEESSIYFGASSLGRDESYLCARFVSDLQNIDNDLFGHLIEIASLALLTEVILDVRNPPDANRKEPDFVVLMDAPLLMDALELGGKDSKARVDDLINSLRKMEIKIWAFSHSCLEVSRNLHNLFERAPSERFGSTQDALRKGEVLESYARSVMEDAEHYVTDSLNINIVRQDLTMLPNSHQYFSNELYDEFSARLWHSSREARNTDAASIALIMRRRGTTQTQDPLKTKFLMVTRNRKLVEFSRRFCSEKKLLEDHKIGPFIHQRALIALMMLTLGYQGKKEFSRRHVLGSCERVLRMNPKITDKAREKLKEIKPSLLPQLEALLTKPRSAQALADKTLNIDSVIKSDNIIDLLSAMEKTLEEKYEQETERKVDKAQKKLYKKNNELKNKISSMDQISARQKAIEKDRKNQNIQTLIGWMDIANDWERKIHKMEIIFFVFLALVLLFTPLFPEEREWIQYLMAVVSFLFALFSLKPSFQNGPISWVLHSRIQGKKRKIVENRAIEARLENLLTEYTLDWTNNSAIPIDQSKTNLLE